MSATGGPERECRSVQREATPASSVVPRPPAPGVEVASPCISICEMSAHNAFCIGCYRTLDEIAAWSVLDPAARRAIVDALPARRAMADRP